MNHTISFTFDGIPRLFAFYKTLISYWLRRMHSHVAYSTVNSMYTMITPGCSSLTCHRGPTQRRRKSHRVYLHLLTNKSAHNHNHKRVNQEEERRRARAVRYRWVVVCKLHHCQSAEPTSIAVVDNTHRSIDFVISFKHRQTAAFYGREKNSSFRFVSDT